MKHLFEKPLASLSSHLGLWHKALQDRTLLNMARNRSAITGGVFVMAFFVIIFRLFDLMVMQPGSQILLAKHDNSADPIFNRADIVDCQGRILATQVVTASVYANPQEILDVRGVVKQIAKVIPGINAKTLEKKLNSNKRFIWIARHVTPKLQHKIHMLGFPGIYLKKDEKRVYPMGNLTSHIVGFTGVDGKGLGGIESSFDKRLRVDSSPLQLSLDIGIQHALHKTLLEQVNKFHAKGGYAMVLDLKTHEIKAIVSLPDFNPHNIQKASQDSLFNRATLGCNEHGSVMKIINTAAALEYGGAKFSNTFDASKPIQVGRYTIKDFRGKNRVLTLPEGFIYSSNIVMVKMAIGFGGAIQRKFLRQLNMTIRPQIEVPEVAMPMIPSEKRWQESTVMTVSYGYGTAFSPVTVMDAIAALIKDGNYISSTILKDGRKTTIARKVISKLNSRKLRHLMRLAVTHGTVRKANVAGYQVIAKTGTANKAFTGGRRRGYNMKERLASCIAAFPMDNPRYIVYAGLDSPQGLKETYGFTAGGWNAAPTVGKIIKAVAPMLGFAQVVDPETARMLQRQNPAIKYIRMDHATR